MKLDTISFGIAAGIFWGVTMFICTLLAFYTGYSTDFLRIIQSLYLGYRISLGGSFIGLIYGFIDAFIAGFILAWLYNKISRLN